MASRQPKFLIKELDSLARCFMHLLFKVIIRDPTFSLQLWHSADSSSVMLCGDNVCVIVSVITYLRPSKYVGCGTLT
jgi:hypothetical protein